MAIFNSYVKLPEGTYLYHESKRPMSQKCWCFLQVIACLDPAGRGVCCAACLQCWDHWAVWQSSKPRVDDVFFGIILANILGIIIIHELGILKLLVEWHFVFWTLRNCVRVCQASYGYGSKIVEASKCWSIPIVICQIWGMKHLFTRYVLTTQIDEDPLRALQASQNMTWQMFMW